MAADSGRSRSAHTALNSGRNRTPEDPPECVRIGTSGWVYKHWMSIFYPPRMPGDQQLPFYAGRFDTVEINYSFYHLPERSVFENWRRQTPEDFLFAVKGSRFLTHMKKLTDPEEPLQRLIDRAEGLEEKLGPILFQFPAQWKLNLPRLEAFMAALRSYAGKRYTFEFRHPSWLVPEVYRLLEDAGAALCLPLHPKMPLDVRLTANWTYIRFHTGRHGTGFGEDELREWAERIRGFRSQGIDTLAYFNNDPEGWAIVNAESLRALLR
jgi:uncharacterized protein YecE (DUF72 family)